jgi:hypothetical protein
MEISIKSAAEMAKVSRNTIYQAIKDGKISRSDSGKVESSEILRVYGIPTARHTRQEEKEHIEQLKNIQNTEQKTKQPLNTLSSDKEELYKLQIKTLEETLSKAYQREEWQRQHIEKLTDTIKLLEPPKPEIQEKQKGFFSRFFN